MASRRAPKGQKKLGKNKKKSWKAIDITEVEEFLEDERLQERTGGLVREKPDEKLFFVEKQVPTEQIQETEPSQKRRKRQPKPLRCFAHLELDSGIKPATFTISRDVHATRLSKKPQRVQKQLVSGHRTATQQRADRQRQQAVEEKREKRKRLRGSQFTDDLWKEEENKTEDDHYLTVTKKRRVKTPSHRYAKPSQLPAVEVPHPGASYNPTYDDHQELLLIAHQVEMKKEKDAQRLYNALEGKFPTREAAPNEKSFLEEMSAGLFNDDKETLTDEVILNGDADRLSVNPPVSRDNPKTRKRETRERREKEEKRLLQKDKETKTLEKDLFRLTSIKKEIKEKERKEAERATKKAEEAKEAAFKTKKLGATKYQDPDTELKLSDELVGSLRLLKPEGHVIEDRFKSLQRRNVIEVRGRAKRKRKYKPKEFDKKGHREIVL